MKKEIIEKWKKNASQKISLIISNPSFQKDVIVLRNKLNIPPEGFSIIQEQQNWWAKEIIEKEKIFYQIEWPKYRQELEGLKKDPVRFKKRQDQINNLHPINSFNNDLEKLTAEYKISHRDIDTIKSFLYYNDVSKLVIRIGPTIEIEDRKEANRQQTKILIDENTTINDIKAIWSSVMVHQQTLIYRKKNKVQPIKNLELYKRAYEINLKEKNFYKISEILNDEFPDKVIGPADIHDYLKRHKRHVGMN